MCRPSMCVQRRLDSKRLQCACMSRWLRCGRRTWRVLERTLSLHQREFMSTRLPKCFFRLFATKFEFSILQLQGYSGKSCSLHITNNVGNEWHYLASAYSGLSPRAAHTAIYVRQTDSLYVYGGYDLNNVLGALQVRLPEFYIRIGSN